MPSETRIRQVQAELGLDYIQARNHVRCQEILRDGQATKWSGGTEAGQIQTVADQDFAVYEHPTGALEAPAYSPIDSTRATTVVVGTLSLLWTVLCFWGVS